MNFDLAQYQIIQTMKRAKKFQTWHRNVMAIPEFSLRYEPSKTNKSG